MKIRKLPAFTLMEVTIAMLLSAISMMIAYTAYHLVSQSYLDYSSKQKHLAEFLSADRLLKMDILNGEKVLKSDDGLIIESERGVITYVFGEAYLLRNQFELRTDTFNLQVRIQDISFESMPVQDGELLDRVGLEMSLEGAELALVYRKQYSSVNLFK